ncbi:FabD/lysophospholipase-like protein, partial [Cadophora sp. DSE1049]
MRQAISVQRNDEPNPLDSTGLCLLSLDGGGVRGLSTLYILKSIIDRLNNERKTASLPPVKPCEVFDLIGGTSTGGLIAIMLGRLEMDVNECIEAYSDLAAAVFSEKSSPYKDSILMIPSFVCTADRDTKDIIRLRSYSLPDEPDIPATICQAALATSAATTFFEPVRIGNRSFADGGLGANNPVDETEGEASNIWCAETGDLKPLVKCFISIGTGDPGKKAFDDTMIKFLGQTVVDIATETQNTERRFNIGLDEYQKLGAMEAATNGYITHRAQKFRVRDCIQNLRMKQRIRDLDCSATNLYNQHLISCLNQADRGVVACNVQWFVPFEQNRCFTGRESELIEIEQLLFTKGGPTKIAIFGLGGVGKTSLTIELVYRIKKDHKDCSVFWIPATNFESLQQAYLNICQQLHLPGWDNKNEDPKRLLQSYLSQASAGQWLLVFDNADDISMWTGRQGSDQISCRLIDYLPTSQDGRIVFTSRDRKTAYDLVQRGHRVEVPELSEDVAMDLLQKYVPTNDLGKHEDDAKSLLEQLTYLPLAIVQAASYINKNDISLATYLLLLADQEQEVIDLLSAHFEDDSRYRDVKNPVATTWLISFKQIQLRDPLAADYLSFMACVDSKNVPQSLLPPGLSRKTEVDAIGTLHAYSFINKRQADSSLDVHRLVHLATRNWLWREKSLVQWSETVVNRLDDVFPNHSHQNRSIWRRYLTHARYALRSQLIDQDAKRRIDLAWKVGNCLDSDGRWKEAESLLVQVTKFRKKVLGDEHPDTLTSMNNLA